MQGGLSIVRPDSSLPVHWNSDWSDKLSTSLIPRVSFTYELHLSFLYSSVWNGQANGANINQLKSTDSLSTIIPGVTFKMVHDSIQQFTYCVVESVSDVSKGVNALIVPGDILLKVNDTLLFDTSEPSMISPSSILATVQPMSTTRVFKILRVPPMDSFPSKVEVTLLAGPDSPVIAKVKMQPMSDQTPSQYNLAIVWMDNYAPNSIRRSIQGTKVSWEITPPNPLGSANLSSNHCVVVTQPDGSTTMKEGVFRDPRGRFLAVAFLPLPPLEPETPVLSTTTETATDAQTQSTKKSVDEVNSTSVGNKRERNEGEGEGEGDGDGTEANSNVTGVEEGKAKRPESQKARKVACCLGKFSSESDAAKAYRKVHLHTYVYLCL